LSVVALAESADNLGEYKAMIIEYSHLVGLLRKSGLPNQETEPGEALYVRFKKIDRVEGSEEFTTPDGEIVKLDLDGEEDLCGIEIVPIR